MDFDNLEHETPAADLESLRYLAMTSKGRVAVEVGSWVGGTARVLAPLFKELYCVDHWMGNPNDRLGAVAEKYGREHVFRTFCRNMDGWLMNGVFPCVGTSAMWASVWRKPIDFLFIDANHDYEAVMADILAWEGHVAPGGMIALHDFGVFFGVTQAVKERFPGYKRAGATLAYVEV